MKFERSSGILLHPSSFPSPYGIGNIGPSAYQWIDILAEMNCGLWQILPLGPTGYGDSPYQCFSAFAGNPYLISPSLLMNNYNLLSKDDLAQHPDFPETMVDYGKVIPWKLKLLDIAYANFVKNADKKITAKYEDFKHENVFWLDDYALFMAIKETQNGHPWNHWPRDLRLRNKKSLTEFQSNFSELIEKQKFWQFLFFDQWAQLKNWAEEKNIKIIGDIPLFVSYDSADTWAHPELFALDEEGNPIFVAGVPPDYFSPTGQLWGNPQYDWEVHKNSRYDWWVKRVQSCLNMVDIIRLDHFRGFADYWEIPANMPTAEIGEWKDGPGESIFLTLQNELGDLPLIAEDLGSITQKVEILRDQFNFPGMMIFQFGFSDPQNKFLPHNYIENCVAYTGTHDNDTVLGLYDSSSDREKSFCRNYLNCYDRSQIVWSMIHRLWSSVAVMTLAPLQDLLNLGSEARMNYPGKPSGNWTWRFKFDQINDQLINKMAEINYLFDRAD